MPHKKHGHGVAFQPDSIVEKPSVLTFKEARRLKGPIYQVLLQELYEEGCRKTAKHFQCLTKKETRLLEQKIIRKRISADPELLTQITDNFMLAEQTCKLSREGNHTIALKLFYQTLQLLERNRDNYNWLISDIYELLIKIVNPLENPSYAEMRMRIFYLYGKHLELTGLDLMRSIQYLSRAFELSKGELWPPESKRRRLKYQTMFEYIPHTLAKVILRQAKLVLFTDPQESMDLASQAIQVLATVDPDDNKVIVIQAALNKIEFLIECKKYGSALSLISRIKGHIIDEERREFKRLMCEVHIQEGTCYYNLNELDKAMESFNKSYTLSFKYNFPGFRAELMLGIGKVLAKNPQYINTALNVYATAKKMYMDLNKKHKVLKTTYLMAKLQVDKFFPHFMNFIKSSDYCKYHALRKWKNQCKPFWGDDFSAGVVLDIKMSSTLKSLNLMMDQEKEKVEGAAKVKKSPARNMLRDGKFRDESGHLECLMKELGTKSLVKK